MNWKLQPSLTALFALAALRSVSRRATFCHKNRPICHFELVGKSVLFFPLVSSREHSLFSIRGAAGALSRGCLRVLFPATNTARAEGRGIKGGYAPLCRRSRLLRSLGAGGPWRIVRSIYAASFLYFVPIIFYINIIIVYRTE